MSKGTKKEEPKGVRAITVKPVWAWANIFGGRPLEIRNWPITVKPGMRIAIHASASTVEADMHAEYIKGLTGVEVPLELEAGAVIGTVEVVACIPLLELYRPKAFDASMPEYQGDGRPPLTVKRWLPKRGDVPGAEKAYAWILANPQPCKPVDCKGKLGFWYYTGPISPLEG